MWSTVCDLVSLKAVEQTDAEQNVGIKTSKPYIFDFDEYEYMIVESDDGKVIAEIRQNQIDVEDGYRVRMKPRKE